VLAKTDMPGVTTSRLEYDSKGDLKNGGITLYKVVGGKWTTLQSVGGK
jgi:branched-chain amino acid transport system substrate-binding protein